MKLYTHCEFCNSQINLKEKTSTRLNLEVKKGKEFDLKCNECRNSQTKHVNDIKAETGYLQPLIGLLLGIAVALFCFFAFKNVVIITTSILTFPLLFIYQERKSTSNFNSNLMSRKK